MTSKGLGEMFEGDFTDIGVNANVYCVLFNVRFIHNSGWSLKNDRRIEFQQQNVTVIRSN